MTNHEHRWIQASATGHSAGDGSGKLLSIVEYCAECGRVRDIYQSASTAEWHHELRDERVLLDVDTGEALGTAACYQW